MTNHLNSLRIPCILLILLSFSSPSRAAGFDNDPVFLYRIKVAAVDDPVTFKDLCPVIESLFDTHVRFNDATDDITFSSEYNVSIDRLSKKLTVNGYTLLSYVQEIKYQSPK